MKIIPGTPFLTHADALVLADTHIGVEAHLRESGFIVEGEAVQFMQNAVELAKRLKLRTFIHLGDVKHTIARYSQKEMKWVQEFFTGINEVFEKIVLVKGNHDGLIEKIVPDYVLVCNSYEHSGVGFVHGHRGVDGLENCRKIVCGHIHPCVRFSAGHGTGARYKCWLIAEVNQKFRAKFGFSMARQLVVMPSASDFVGMKAINTGELDSFMVAWEYLKKQRSAIHLIDGTFLGSFTHAMMP